MTSEESQSDDATGEPSAAGDPPSTDESPAAGEVSTTDTPTTGGTDGSDQRTGGTDQPNGGTDQHTDGSDQRTGRPLVAGTIGLLAGIAGGIVATTIAPGNLFLTIPLIVVVVLVVTLGTLRVLAR